MLIAGLFMPITVAIWGGLYIIARLGYVCAYMKSPKQRMMFVPMIVGTQILLPLFTIIVCLIFMFMVPDDNNDKLKSGLHTQLWQD